jgi:hypothetical protein
MAWDPRENAQGFTPEEEEVWKGGNDWSERQVAVKMRDERRQREREEALRQQWADSEDGRAFRKLARSFATCKRLLSENPEAESEAQEKGARVYAVYAKLKENLARANQAPRCCYVKTGGELCKAPKVKGQEYCNMHLAMTKTKEDVFELPPLDDANAVQVAIAQGAQGLLKGTLDEKRAMRLAYYLQLAVTNVSRVNFEPEYEDA